MMDKIVKSYPAVLDLGNEPSQDLMICLENGVAYQREMGYRSRDEYFDTYVGYEGSEIAQKLNAGRKALVNRYVLNSFVIDIGVGSGEFIKSRLYTFGYDVDPKAVAWLKKEGYWFDLGSSTAYHVSGFTFWDSLEHVQTPNDYFCRIRHGAFIFVSLPIFSDLTEVRASKHFRPGEHLYYWTEVGFIQWMWHHGFRMLEKPLMFEVEAGREGILSFVFRKDG